MTDWSGPLTDRPPKENTMSKEPVLSIVVAAQAFGLACVALAAIVFGWDAETTAAVGTVVQTALAVVSAVVARSKVTPV